MKRIDAWQAEGGAIFLSQKECASHEKLITLSEKFQPIYGSSEGCKIYLDDFASWVAINMGWLEQYIAYRKESE